MITKHIPELNNFGNGTIGCWTILHSINISISVVITTIVSFSTRPAYINIVTYLHKNQDDEQNENDYDVMKQQKHDISTNTMITVNAAVF